MLIKNNLFCALIFTGFISSACAGGVEVPAASPPQSANYFYAEGNLGYAIIPWYRISEWDGPFSTLNFHGDAGATFGVDGGVMFRFLGVELGWFDLPSVYGNVTNPFFPNVLNNITVNSNFAYVAGKVSVPIYDNFQVFGKVGGANRHFSYQGNALPSRASNSYWTPIFAGGVQYALSHWILNIQYVRVPGSEATRPITRKVAAANLYTFALGYKFNF